MFNGFTAKKSAFWWIIIIINQPAYFKKDNFLPGKSKQTPTISSVRKNFFTLFLLSART